MYYYNRMKKSQKIIYINNNSTEVIQNKLKKKKIDKNYKYISKNFFYNLFGNLCYFCLAKPITWFIFKFIRHIKYKNTKVLKQHKKGGYFVYCNHTDAWSDALSPALICNPKKPRIICDSSNLSIPIVGFLTKQWGALPLPDDLQATKNFYAAIASTLNKNAPIIIYPEAHLWPYYTKIRPYSSISFRYPIKYNKPVYTFTTTYHKRRFSKKPRLEIYVDGPFYPNSDLHSKESQEKMRDICFNKMRERAKLNTYEFIKYKKRSSND